jgi:hypothetical protein
MPMTSATGVLIVDAAETAPLACNADCDARRVDAPSARPVTKGVVMRAGRLRADSDGTHG